MGSRRECRKANKTAGMRGRMEREWHGWMQHASRMKEREPNYVCQTIYAYGYKLWQHRSVSIRTWRRTNFSFSYIFQKLDRPNILLVQVNDFHFHLMKNLLTTDWHILHKQFHIIPGRLGEPFKCHAYHQLTHQQPISMFGANPTANRTHIKNTFE